MKNKIPTFKTLAEEARFWDNHNITDYWDEMEEVKLEFIPRQKKEQSVTIRLEPELKKRLDQVARKNNLTISTITRLWLIEKLQEKTYSSSRR